MSAELSNDGKKKPRHPWDWYVDLPWVTERLLDHAPIDRDVVMIDPCCGSGNIVAALRGRGIDAFGTDLFDRGSQFFLGTHDFIGEQRALYEAFGKLSIVMNSPFSYQDGKLVRGLASRFVRRALEVATHQVAALLPLKWLSSQERYELYTDPATAPIGAWILTERPSMPPGDQIEALGKRAWARGKVDYMWLLWDKRREPHFDARGIPFVPTYWIPPRGEQRRAA
jgi:hypothetical protein